MAFFSGGVSTSKRFAVGCAMETLGCSQPRAHGMLMSFSILLVIDIPFLIGEPSINGQFSMAMLNNQMVIDVA